MRVYNNLRDWVKKVSDISYVGVVHGNETGCRVWVIRGLEIRDVWRRRNLFDVTQTVSGVTYKNPKKKKNPPPYSQILPFYTTKE